MSFNARIKSKRDTASNWETNNPVLLNGELIIVDTNAGDVRFKIGDGVKTYTQLPFQDESLYNVLSTKADSADLESIQASIVQSDLSQTDNTAKDYVKGIIRQESLPDGYPYKYTETILDGTFEFTGSGSIRTYQITDENFTITPGRSYTIIWDGVTYQCVATNSAGLPTIGNLAIAGVTPNTGEPFLFINNTNKLIYTTDTAATHTIIVHEEIVHMIAKELLPEIYFSELIINDPEAAKTALAIENGMVLKNLQAAMPGDECWQSVTYGNGKFVAVSENGSMAAYSENGVTWTAITMPSNSQWASVTYGNGKFVTVASGSSSNRAAYSEDGITWTAATLPSSSQWRSVTYGNGKFVAVDYSSTNAAYSEDGITWTAATMPSSEYWNYVTYGNGKFVAVAWSTTAAAYSADGITWTSSTMPSSEYWSSVTYGNGKFVAVAQGSTTAAYSADGITWTATTMPNSADWKSITYGNGKFVAVAYNSNKAAYSTDGATWTATTMPSSRDWQSVTYGNGKFVAVAEFSVSAPYSEDGITWKTTFECISQNESDITENVRDVLRIEGYPYKEMESILDGTFEFVAGGGMYSHRITDENFTITPGRSYTVIWDGETYQRVATTLSGLPTIGNLAIAGVGADTGEPFLFAMETSKDIYTKDTAATHTVIVHEEIIYPIASEFLPGGMKDAIDEKMSLVTINAQMPSSDYWKSVTYANGKFVAIINNSSQAAYSEDGINWTSSTMPSSSSWESVTYGNGKFVAVAYNSSQAAYSEDGINWTSSTMPSSSGWQSVTYGNGKFVAITTRSGIAAYSEDGISWTSSTMPNSNWWESVTYGNGKFVAVANGSNTAAYSEDGISWTSSTMPSSSDWQSVTYGNGKFVAIVYDSSIAAYSEDGINWTSSTMPSSGSWRSVAYGNGKFVAIASCSRTAAYSEDGISWTSSTMPSNVPEWQFVTYGNGKFVVVVRNSDLVVYSKDGINWNTELKLISQNGKDVTADTLIALGHQPDLSQTDSTQIDYVKGVIRQESLPEGYPYITKKSIEWDGDTTGKIAVNNTFYKVSDEIPSNDELKENGILYATNNANQTMSGTNISQIWNAYISYGTITNDYAFLEYIAVIRNANTEISGTTFPEPGTYFLKQSDILVTKLDYSKVSKLDDKYFDSAYVIDVKVGQADNGDETFTLTSGNFSDAYSAHLNKKIIIMQMNGYSGNTLVCVGADTSDQLKFADLTKNLNYFRIRILQFASDNTISVYQENNLAYYDHTQAASTITAGTFAGQVAAYSSGQTPGTMLLRNSKLVSAEETPTVNGEICWVYS